MRLFTSKKGQNIKGYALREYAKTMQIMGSPRMLFTFFDHKGSFSAVSAILDILPRPIILLFDRHYMKNVEHKELLALCGEMAIYGNFSVYAVGGEHPKSGKIIAKLLFSNTGDSARIITLSSVRDNANKTINTYEYGTVAEKFACSVISSGTFKVMPFGFQDKIFIKEFTNYFVEQFANIANEIKHVFMVIGSGTTLISLFHAFNVVQESNAITSVNDSIILESNTITFHCTIVGRSVDQDMIAAECPGINVVYYKSPVPYYADLPNFEADEFGSERLNAYISLCPHYDSKLLIGVREFCKTNSLNDTSLLALFVIVHEDV